MSWLKRIERRLEPFAIPHLTLYLVIGQTFVYLAIFLNLLDPMKVVFAPTLVMHGQVWRLVTFLFFPPMAHWALIAFGLYFLYFTGNTLEGYWGTVRYNLFILTGYLLTVGVAFLTPDVIATNVFIGGSIFLAFAYLNPDFVMYVFLVLPVKMRWMAILAWAGYAWEFFTGGPAAKLAVLAATGNFLLFFGRDIWLDIRAGRRRMQTQARRMAPTEEDEAPRHKCYVCGRNSNDEPRLDFRYCSKCAGDQCYCPDHIHNHVHVLTTDEPPKS
jgi:hypothetical protein